MSAHVPSVVDFCEWMVEKHVHFSLFHKKMDNEEVVMVEQVDKKWDALIEEIERIRKEKFKEGVEYFKLKIQEAIKKGKVPY